MKNLIFLCCLVAILGCKKEVKYVVEKSTNPFGSNPPDTFSVLVGDIQDKQARVYWTKASDPDHDTLTYEIALGDSVIAYDLLQYGSGYFVKNLLPDHDYSVTVAALNPARICRKVTRAFHTLKSFITSSFNFNLGYDEYSFNQGIKTHDNGLLLSGFANNFNKRSTTVYFLLKLNPDLTIQWLKEYPNLYSSLYQCKDNSYLVTSADLFSKIDLDGNVVWNYTFPEADKIYLDGSFDNADNEIFTVGHSSRNPSGSAVMDEYFIAKFSSGGTFIREQFGGTSWFSYPQAGFQLPDGNLVLFGRAECTGNTPGTQDWEDANWLLTLDAEFNFISQHFYPNTLIQRSEMPHSFILMPDNGFMLFSTTFGIINGFSNCMARFMRINPDYSVLWDKKYYLNSKGDYPGLTDYDQMGDGSFLVLCTDDEGLNISILSSAGDNIRQVKMDGFPVGLLIKYEQDQNLILLTQSGDVFLISLDGYVDDLKAELTKFNLAENKMSRLGMGFADKPLINPHTSPNIRATVGMQKMRVYRKLSE